MHRVFIYEQYRTLHHFIVINTSESTNLQHRLYEVIIIVNFASNYHTKY